MERNFGQRDIQWQSTLSQAYKLAEEQRPVVAKKGFEELKAFVTTLIQPHDKKVQK